MTKEEREKAIELLDNLKGMIEDSQNNDYDFAFRKAIEALKQFGNSEELDCISRKTVIDLIEHYNSDGLGSVFYGYDEGVKFANAVNKLPSVNPQEPKTEWIPVSESPKEDGRYLAYIVNEHDTKLRYTMTCVYIARSNFWFPDDECASDNVVAWMPLPKPYKTESEENES